jgi:TctA family transporter
MAQGDMTTFFTRPLSATIIAIAAIIILWPLLSKIFLRSGHGRKPIPSGEEI